jgi:hypothetical protein
MKLLPSLETQSSRLFVLALKSPRIIVFPFDANAIRSFTSSPNSSLSKYEDFSGGMYVPHKNRSASMLSFENLHHRKFFEFLAIETYFSNFVLI